MSLLDIFRSKSEPESVPVESWQVTRLRELEKELPQLNEDLADVDARIRTFFSRSDDPRITSLFAQDGRQSGAVLVENQPLLRLLELQRDGMRARFANVLAERAELLK